MQVECCAGCTTYFTQIYAIRFPPLYSHHEFCTLKDDPRNQNVRIQSLFMCKLVPRPFKRNAVPVVRLILHNSMQSGSVCFTPTMSSTLKDDPRNQNFKIQSLFMCKLAPKPCKLNAVPVLRLISRRLV